MESDGERIRSTSNEKVGAAEELIQALIAAAHYLAVLDSIIRSEPISAPSNITETLGKSISQVERASDVARRLHVLLSD